MLFAHDNVNKQLVLHNHHHHVHRQQVPPISVADSAVLAVSGFND